MAVFIYRGYATFLIIKMNCLFFSFIHQYHILPCLDRGRKSTFPSHCHLQHPRLPRIFAGTGVGVLLSETDTRYEQQYRKKWLNAVSQRYIYRIPSFLSISSVLRCNLPHLCFYPCPRCCNFKNMLRTLQTSCWYLLNTLRLPFKLAACPPNKLRAPFKYAANTPKTRCGHPLNKLQVPSKHTEDTFQYVTGTPNMLRVALETPTGYQNKGKKWKNSVEGQKTNTSTSLGRLCRDPP